ncbi:conserved hypothetical protein [Escherichia coli O26:H11]|nr:conserved hypothetical protein [Escherichia coli O26:H11]
MQQRKDVGIGLISRNTISGQNECMSKSGEELNEGRKKGRLRDLSLLRFWLGDIPR